MSKIGKKSFVKYEMPKATRGEKMTTLAVGEEGGIKPGKTPTLTTLAVGEEGGGKPVKGDTFTTMAVGEEGGGSHGITKRLPEEGGAHPISKGIGAAVGKAGAGHAKKSGPGDAAGRAAKSKLGKGEVTTLAIGEEGGARLDKIKPGVVTMAAGEDGSSRTGGAVLFKANKKGD